MTSESYHATVTSIISGNSPYAVAESQDVPDSVTFSLGTTRNVWSEDNPPTVGSEVILTDVRKVRKKWRAYSARFCRPSDAD